LKKLQNNTKGWVEGIVKRIKRAYPSFIRDIHFAALMKKYLPEYEIFYDVKLDMTSDIDLLVIKDGIYYGVILYVLTDRAISQREHKTCKQFANVNYIEIPLQDGKAGGTAGKDYKNCGNFWLYNEKHIDIIRKETEIIVEK
jgi:hypothetical protein